MSKVPCIIYAVSFIDLLAVGLIVPLLPQHLRSLGASHTTIGLLSSLYSALQVISGPVVGSWSDIRGRKYVTFRTLILCSICYLLLGFTASIPCICVLRFILGLSKHTQTLLKAVIGDCCPIEKHSEIFGFSSAIGSLGFVIGPVIGGHLSELQYGFEYACFLTSILFLSNIIFVYFINIPLETNTRAVSAINIKGDLLKATSDLAKVNWHVYWDAFTLRFLFGCATSIYFSNQSLYLLNKFQLSQKSVGYLISFLSIIASVSSFSLGIIKSTFYSTDHSCFKRLFHGFWLLSLSFIGLCMSPNVYFLVTVLIPFGVANGILRNVSMEAILTRCDQSERGSVAGSVGSVMSISRFVSPILSGVVGDMYGQESIMILAFLPSMCGTLLSIRLFYKSKEVLKTRLKLD